MKKDLDKGRLPKLLGRRYRTQGELGVEVMGKGMGFSFNQVCFS